jgi:hypothetical protein
VAEELRELPVALERDERLVGPRASACRPAEYSVAPSGSAGRGALHAGAHSSARGGGGIGNDRRGDLDQALEELGFQLIGRLADDAREDGAASRVEPSTRKSSSRCPVRRELAPEAVGHEARTP